ncbi:MAG: hypothetical protein A4E28_01627 [Methanocella sp. PtaU1.Bin125]|nr:MAG: hypothetical protein A4E28_01627 [Methanocella sp. PtaU1.Bin125]
MRMNVLKLAIAGIAILFIALVAMFGVSMVLMPGAGHIAAPAQNESPDDTPDAGDSLPVVPGNIKTAFGSLSMASADTAVREWLADKTTVYVAGIASDFCVDGESDQWTITYASDKGQYIVFVTGGSIVETRDSQSSPQQGIDPRALIDSDRAWGAVADDIKASGGTLPETVSMKLMIVAGTPCWDVSYQASDGFRILRIDASDGTISDRATIG